MVRPLAPHFACVDVIEEILRDVSRHINIARVSPATRARWVKHVGRQQSPEVDAGRDMRHHAAWIFFSLFVAAAYGQPVKNAAGTGPMNNVDLPGSDIKHFTLAAPPPGQFDIRMNQCSAACSTNKDCVAWTYVKPNTIQGPLGNCWLKSAIPAQAANNCCVSGVIGEANTDRPGRLQALRQHRRGSGDGEPVRHGLLQGRELQGLDVCPPEHDPGPEGELLAEECRAGPDGEQVLHLGLLHDDGDQVMVR